MVHTLLLLDSIVISLIEVQRVSERHAERMVTIRSKQHCCMVLSASSVFVSCCFSRRAAAFRPAANTLLLFSKRQVSVSSLRLFSTMSNNETDDAPQLVDVDCNLWHKDLPSLLSLACSNDESTKQQEDSNNDDNVPDCFQILRHDNVSNTIAMLSPSSTIAEAKTGLQALQQLKNDDATSSDIVKLLFPVIRTTVGVHPYHVQDEKLQGKSIESHMETVKDLILSHRADVVAVGECGLDASEGFPKVSNQVPWFQAQIQLATDLQLPLFVHERLAFDSTMDRLQNAVNVPIIIHCFTGTAAECQAYVDRGYFLSVSGYIFREDAADVRQVLQEGIIPLDRLMIETDAPYMGFAGCREAFLAHNAAGIATLNSKKRKRWTTSQYPNPPSSLTAVAHNVLYHINLGRARRSETELTMAEFALQTTRNANSFFGFDLNV